MFLPSNLASYKTPFLHIQEYVSFDLHSYSSMGNMHSFYSFVASGILSCSRLNLSFDLWLNKFSDSENCQQRTYSTGQHWDYHLIVPVRMPAPPAGDSCSRDNFYTTFGISFIFGTIVGPDLYITWIDLGRFLLWSWPRFFKVKYRISYSSAKSGLIAMEQKANILIELQASNVTNVFDLDQNLDLSILKVKRDLNLSPHTWPWPWIFMVKF